MNSLKRNKRVLYLCKKYIEDNLTKYSKPEEIKINYEPTNSVGEIISLGIEYTEYLKAVDIPEICNQFKNGDRCYVYVTPPEEYSELCEDADFVVFGQPIITLNQGVITLKRLTGDRV